MTNSYRKLADICDELAEAFLGKEIDPQPLITISGDGHTVVVIWDVLLDLGKSDRTEMVVEAYWQAFGPEKGLSLHCAMGLTVKESIVENSKLK